MFSRPMPPGTALPPGHDMEDVHTAWGVLPRWKARALALGEIQQVINDAANGLDDQPVKPSADPEDKPPPVAADQAYRADLIEQLQDACDRISARLDRIEKEREAEQALETLEDVIEKEADEPAPEEPTTKH